RVEDVELRLRAEVAGVGDAGGGQELLGLTGHVARVTAVGLAGDRVVHEEVHVERLVLAERVRPRGLRVREQRHVGLVDRLEAAHGRAVEGDATVDEVLVELGRGDGQGLHDAGQVAEPDVDVLDLLVRDVLEYLFGVVEHAHGLLRLDAVRTARYGRGVARTSLVSFLQVNGDHAPVQPRTLGTWPVGSSPG